MTSHPSPSSGCCAEARLDLRHQHLEILAVGWVLKTRDEGLIGKSGGAVIEVEAKREEREHHRETERNEPLRAPGLGLGALPFFGVRGKQAPRNLDAGGFGVGVADQTTLAVAFDLFELIAIDRGIEGGTRALFRAPRRQRAQQDVEHRSRQRGENHPDQHLADLRSCREASHRRKASAGGKLWERDAGEIGLLASASADGRSQTGSTSASSWCARRPRLRGRRYP